MVKLVSVNNGPLASNLIHVIGLKKTRDDGSTIVSDTITIGREGTTTNIDSLVVSNIGYGSKNTLSIAGNVNVSIGTPTAVLSFTTTSVAAQWTRNAYGGGKFVIIGDIGKVFYSTNGTSWTQVTSPTFSGYMVNIVYSKDRFMIVTDTPTNVYTSLDGVTWITGATIPNYAGQQSVSYGNDFTVAVKTNSNILSVFNNVALTWFPAVTLTTGLVLKSSVFGTMSTATNGTNVFLVFGDNNAIRRNQSSPDVSGNWTEPTTYPSINIGWNLGGFGNDTFILTSASTPGYLTISRDAGKTWSTPINFGIKLKQPIYVDGEWYIFSDEGFIMISKNNGLTWEKRITNTNIFYAAYGNGLLVGVDSIGSANNATTLIGLKKKREDGSLITSDTITIGREGTNTTLVGNTVSLAGNVTVTAGNPTTEISFTTTSVAGAFSRIAFGGGKFVVYGYLAKLYYSTNGINWTLGTYPTIDFGARLLLYTGDRFLFFSDGATTQMFMSMDGITWNLTPFITTAPYGNVTRAAAGNNIAILATYNTGNISVSTDNTGRTWTNLSLASTLIYQVGFGRMSSGINVFLLVGPNMIKRNDNIYNRLDNWVGPANTPSGNWWYIGFGNDTFIITSSDLPGKLSISRDGGNTWSTPIDFGLRLRQPVYFEGDWYIGADTSFMMISKNNGFSWEKKLGKDIETFASGNNLLLSVNDTASTNILINVFGIKKKRDDGSLITSDTITIGSEGHAKTIDIRAVTIYMSGYVGIGTTTPLYPLQLVGNTINAPTPSGFMYHNVGQPLSSTGSITASNITIYSSDSILTLNSFVAASDRRIKTNIVDIDDDRALRDLRLLKPKTYTYTDFIQKGTTPVYGFIAQEVKEVLNYASFPITETVPNVYELATFSGDTLTLVMNTTDLSRDASGALFTKLKLKTREEKDEFVRILEIIDEHTLRVDKDLSNFGGDQIFVYGQEVSDFHTLNKDAIWTVATAALQEVDRQLQAEKQKTSLMQTALDSLLERVLALEQKTSV